MFESMLTSRLISADVCGTVMDSLSVQMAQVHRPATRNGALLRAACPTRPLQWPFRSSARRRRFTTGQV